MKILFILGGNGDIGSAIVKKFSENGYRVIAPPSTELNLSSRDSIKKYFEKHQNFDIDVLIHSAGFNNPKPLEDIDFNDFDKTMAINAMTFPVIIKHFLPAIKRKKNGYILAISSLYGSIARKNRLPYVMSKHAMNGLVKTLAIELGSFNIKVNSLSPGLVDTKMTRKNNSRETIGDFENRIPLGRLASPLDIANVAYFLCSPENTYITGQDIIVDGGFSIGGFQK